MTASTLSPEAAAEQIVALGVVPVVELAELAHARPMLEALCGAGLAVAEITLRTAAALEAIALLSESHPGALVGAGTVRSLDDAVRAIEAGASFLVSPGIDPELVAFCRAEGVLAVPGACTPSEVQAAQKAGAPLVKFFPAEPSGGLGYLKALAGPFHDVRFVPSGGVNAANLADYLRLPQVVACGGSWMVAPGLLAAGDFARVGELAAEAVAIVAATRASRASGGSAVTDATGSASGGAPADAPGSPGSSGSPASLQLRPPEQCRFDLVALGEVMLRLDPGEGRIATARSFTVFEGGGEYNVARGLRRCFGLRTAVVTALADNPIGRLVEDLMLQGGVDVSHVSWVPYDGIGRSVRNGLNFTERGFGVRGALGCSDRGNTAVSQLRAGSIDFDAIFSGEGARWLHTGGIFAGLSPGTAEVAEEAMAAARRAGVVVSYDLNFRPSLWKAIGGPARAAEVNRRLVGLCDVVFGNEEDFSAALGFEISGSDSSFSSLEQESYTSMLASVATSFPNLKAIATSLRQVRSASLNDWSGICWASGEVVTGPTFEGLEILDRVGGGDSFASGMIYGLLSGMEVTEALRYAIAHGALAMTTPGDTSMATLDEVRRLVEGGSARVVR